MTPPRLPDPGIAPGVVVLFQICALTAREFSRRVLELRDVAANIAIHLGAVAGFVALAFLLVPPLWRRRALVARVFETPINPTKTLLIAFAVGLLLRLADWLGRLSVGILTFAAKPDAWTGHTFWWQCPEAPELWLGIAVRGVVTPFVEEFVFRGLVFAALLKHGTGRATLFSSAIFALLHPATTIPAAFLFAIVAARQYLAHRTLLVPIVSHATFNLMITVDWECLNGIWLPASTSIVAGLSAACFSSGSPGRSPVQAHRNESDVPVRPALSS